MPSPTNSLSNPEHVHQKVNVEISTFVAKKLLPVFSNFANIKKNPSRFGETQALSHRRKRGKIEKCYQKNPPAVPPVSTSNQPLLSPPPPIQ
jgi:hypothetical protein